MSNDRPSMQARIADAAWYHQPMRARVLLLFICLSFACKQDRGPHSVSDQSDIPVPPPSEPVETIETCYAGDAYYGTSEADLAAAPSCDRAAEGCMDPQPVVVRRTLTPASSTIIEEWAEGPTESTHPTLSMLAMTIAESGFVLSVRSVVNPLAAESERKQLMWTGEGELTGAPWQWTAWTYKQERQPPITDVVTVGLDGGTLHRNITFTAQNGSVVLRRREQLHEFPCADWDARREATLSAPTPE